MAPRPIAGVDGCRTGWVAVVTDADLNASPIVHVAVRFADLLARLPDDTIVAVDMPIGLPERIGPDGRGPERAVRPLLGMRQSSVFSVPSRSAVFAQSFQEACAIARATSDPPKAVSKQCFYLFDKIREIDALLTAEPLLIARVFEVHPEVAFWRLNGEQAMSLPKKVKSRPDPPGLDERRALLERCGLPTALFQAPLAKGVGADDRLDAAACCLIARRIATGAARPFPDPPAHDARGLPIAIWA
ncbi:DUF429 domain-containing protein [Amorphus sp. 3PC139-8]|uniref:DUF429 domain-containing protein n=1 Tax=Amorphus sp. 3PC139-8 TaxID=2735676 RepID=UPI00345DE2AC